MRSVGMTIEETEQQIERLTKQIASLRELQRLGKRSPISLAKKIDAAQTGLLRLHSALKYKLSREAKNILSITVYMLAFHSEPGQPVVTRTVDVPKRNWERLSLREKLFEVFHWGQNDFQLRKGIASVSMGDVIFLEGRKYVILSTGYGLVSDKTYRALLELDCKTRILAAMLSKRDI